ncbi:hypothetical protein [Paenibacillus sp. LjRoot153]|uniref:hypothetical protein n=1 Tax=Paenibacillus sp. LjRoot153 TaxID=3342270 RepID=UPI003F4F88C7
MKGINAFSPVVTAATSPNAMMGRVHKHVAKYKEDGRLAAYFNFLFCCSWT